jgi:hypothetical protein
MEVVREGAGVPVSIKGRGKQPESNQMGHFRAKKLEPQAMPPKGVSSGSGVAKAKIETSYGKGKK